MTEDDFEVLGQLSDKLDNATHAAVLPIPDSLHKTALTGICESVRDELRAFLAANGFNPWSETDE